LPNRYEAVILVLMDERNFSPESVLAEIAAEVTTADTAATQAAEARQARWQSQQRTDAARQQQTRETAQLQCEERRHIVSTFIGIFATEGSQPDPYERLNGGEDTEIMPTPEPKRGFLVRPRPARALLQGWKVYDESTITSEPQYIQGSFGETLIAVPKIIHNYLYIDTEGEVYAQPPIDNGALYTRLKDYVKQERQDRAAAQKPRNQLS
jgi:hypothetical protein